MPFTTHIHEARGMLETLTGRCVGGCRGSLWAPIPVPVA